MDLYDRQRGPAASRPHRSRNADASLSSDIDAHAAQILTDFAPPFQIDTPTHQSLPLVFCSPHSGRVYPKSFLAASNLSPMALRRSEDSFVEEIFAGGPKAGAPLLHAHFPRAYLDPNREPYELDPAMFAEPLPPHVNTRSLRVAGGLGTIARIVSEAVEIYAKPLSYAQAEARITTLYMPFHEALRGLLNQTHARFGFAMLIDCHSMPSVAGPSDDDLGLERPDIILGDRYGSSCTPEMIGQAERIFTELGYSVARNKPYAGGFNTEHYGQPGRHLHAFQIEINRALYMDETSFRRRKSLRQLTRDMTLFAEELGQIALDLLPGHLRNAAE